MENTRQRLEREQQNRERRREEAQRREKFRGGFDYTFIVIILFLIGFGLVMLYSASYYSAQKSFGDGFYYLRRQAVFSVVAVMAMLVTSMIDYHVIVKFSPFILVMSYGIMALVRFSPLGVDVNGAKRWLKIPGLGTIQPSEFTKIAVILIVTYMAFTLKKEFHTYKGIVKIVAVVLLTAFLTFYLTDHLSAAIIEVGIAYIIVYIANRKSKVLGILAVAGITGGLIVAKLAAVLFDEGGNFRIQRLLVWNDPEKYMSDGGYQILQGLYAIGSGGFFGKGLGNSSQKLGFIPEAQNDMIVSIICEELGVFGVILMLLMFGFLLYRLVFIARNAIDATGGLVVTGIFAHIALQVVLNLCVVLNVIPTTGITLPFISCGGSAIVFLMVEMGIAMSVSMKTKQRIRENEDKMAENETAGIC